jgi:hypothetical protein
MKSHVLKNKSCLMICVTLFKKKKRKKDKKKNMKDWKMQNIKNFCVKRKIRSRSQIKKT